jgi:poly(A) polymerase
MDVLLHHAPAADVQRIVERLKFSRAKMQHIVALAENLPRFSQVRNMSTSDLKRFFRLNRFEDHLELARIHSVAQSEEPLDYVYALSKRTEWTNDVIWPEPLITGDDLIAMGFSPGPRFKEILLRVEDEQLEGRLTTREAAIEFVKRNFGSL